MAHTVVQKDGRSWTVNGAKQITELSRTYLVKLENGSPLGANGEIKSVTGLPAIGSKHPVHTDLSVTGYSFNEGTGSNKNTLEVDVTYSAPEDPGQSQETAEETKYACERWGWDMGTAQRDVLTDIDGKAVVNSAGDPFEQAVQASTYAPTFTKVMKFKSRQSGAIDFNCYVNDDEVEIGDHTFDARTLLCSVSEERIFGDPDYNYRYTIQLKYLSNKQKVEDGEDATECGWDACVVDAGMRAWNDDSGKKEIIKFTDYNTGKVLSVTSPALLDGAGKARVPQSSTDEVSPYVFRFRLYPEDEFPEWFYSEPGIQS